MKLLGRAAVSFCIALVVAGCGGSSTPADPVASEPTAAPTTETVEAEPTAAPTAVEVETPTPEPETLVLSEAEMIAAAQAAFDAEPGAAIAWDPVDAVVRGDKVTLTICEWTGETIYDAVRTAEYQVVAAADGPPTTKFLFDGLVVEDCVNAELIESALQFVDTYNTYWDSVRAEPSSFDVAEAQAVLSAANLSPAQQIANEWRDSNVRWMGHTASSDMRATSVNDLLWRRYEVDGDGDVLELLGCEPIDTSFGLYRDDVLLEDFKGDATAEFVIRQYRLVRVEDAWQMAGGDESAWADCAPRETPWLDRINDWQPDPLPWEELPDA